MGTGEVTRSIISHHRLIHPQVEKRSTCFRLHTLRETRITLSDALGSLGPGAGGGRKAMQEAEQRFEWVSTVWVVLTIDRYS